jgi:Kef-type K+ transport system membrane component KefB
MVAAMNFGNLVAVLAVAAAVPLILAAVPRVRVPGPVLEIVAGIVLGPAVLDLVKPDQAVRLVSTIGLAFLLFLVGLEVDVRHFRGPRWPTITSGVPTGRCRTPSSSSTYSSGGSARASSACRASRAVTSSSISSALVCGRVDRTARA